MKRLFVILFGLAVTWWLADLSFELYLDLSTHAELDQMDDIEHQSDLLLAQIKAAEEINDQDEVIRLVQEHRALIEQRLGASKPATKVIPAPYAQLYEALLDGTKDEIASALRPGMKLNVHLGPYDSVPLHRAMKGQARSVAVIQMLLDAGADPSFATPEGYTALHFLPDTHFAANPIEELVEIIQLLVAAGADLEARQHWGWTPLLTAVMSGNTRETEAFLRAGANPNVRFGSTSLPTFSQGQTALMGAGSETDKVRLLLQYGARTDFTSTSGFTPRRVLEKELLDTSAKLSVKLATGAVNAFD